MATKTLAAAAALAISLAAPAIAHADQMPTTPADVVLLCNSDYTGAFNKNAPATVRIWKQQNLLSWSNYGETKVFPVTITPAQMTFGGNTIDITSGQFFSKTLYPRSGTCQVISKQAASATWSCTQIKAPEDFQWGKDESPLPKTSLETFKLTLAADRMVVTNTRGTFEFRVFATDNASFYAGAVLIPPDKDNGTDQVETLIFRARNATQGSMKYMVAGGHISTGGRNMFADCGKE
jgi:hypothetical protein